MVAGASITLYSDWFPALLRTPEGELCGKEGSNKGVSIATWHHGEKAQQQNALIHGFSSAVSSRVITGD